MVDRDAQPGVQAVSLRINHSRPGAAFQLDELYNAIVDKLQQDGRRSFRAIARSVGVSEGTVRTRVRRIEDAGALRILTRD